MPRPHCRRFVEDGPVAAVFKPAGIPAHALATVSMTLDEFEALRLADLEGLYQEAAAARMGVSRATLGRILESARRKVAEALVMGRALHIAGGPVVSQPRGPGCAHRGRRCRDAALSSSGSQGNAGSLEPSLTPDSKEKP